MSVVDRGMVLSNIAGAVLELGCGPSKTPGRIGIDRIDYPGVDLVGDVFEVLGAIPSGVIREIHSTHFFEHVPDTERLVADCARVLARGGVMRVRVPHFSNPWFYSDPTHCSFFGLYTFSYLAESKLWRRPVPTYQAALEFEIVSVRKMFRSPGFRGRNLLKRGIESLVNSHRSVQEWHEENLTWIVPCYMLDFELRRR